jgi:hypothetical protein
MSGYGHNRFIDPVTHTRPTQDAAVHARASSNPPADSGQDSAEWLRYQQYLKRTRADPAQASVATDPVRSAPQANVSSHPLQEERDIGRNEEVELDPVEIEVFCIHRDYI